MKISKITKMLPILLLFTAMPAFADPVTPSPVIASPVTLDTYTLTLAEHVQLREKAGSNVKTATTSFIGDYVGLHLDAAMKAEFEVITNQPRKIKLTAICPNGTQALVPTLSNSALSDASKFSVVFAKSGGLQEAEDIAAIVNGVTADGDNNQDCFSIPVELVVTRTLPDGDLADVTTTWDDGFVYQIANGTYGFAYTFDEDADQQTFNTHDSAGTYTATITMTDLGKI